MINESQFPADFRPLLERDLSSEAVSQLFLALDSQPQTSVRLNPYKCDGLALPSEDLVEWSAGYGYYLEQRPVFTLDPHLHSGVYYVQEASSMIVGEVAKQFAPQRVLDLCAAPGGKSTHLSTIVGKEGVVVANEVIGSRAAILRENAIKWGSGNIVVTSSDPSRFSALEGMFDLVVVDAPCSGEGMFRKDRNARAEWSLQGVDNCVMRSRRIVSDCWNSLQVGGVMIYSTCTFNHQENEELVEWICKELSAEVIPQDWKSLGAKGVVDNGSGGHFYPSEIRGEGLFCAAIRKLDHSNLPSAKNRPPRKMDRPTKADQKELEKWTKEPLNYRQVAKTIYGYNKATAQIIEELLSNLKVIYSGVEIGEMIRGELKPSHPMALYHNLQYQNQTELDLENALAYLRRGELNRSLYSDGLSKVTYQNIALGWAKALPNRVNNGFPQEWRIRM